MQIICQNMHKICIKYAGNMQEICNKICRIICKKYDKYASKYDNYAMCIYYGKYARKYAKYVKFADHVENMQNMHSPGHLADVAAAPRALTVGP